MTLAQYYRTLKQSQWIVS